MLYVYVRTCVHSGAIHFDTMRCMCSCGCMCVYTLQGAIHFNTMPLYVVCVHVYVCVHPHTMPYNIQHPAAVRVFMYVILYVRVHVYVILYVSVHVWYVIFYVRIHMYVILYERVHVCICMCMCSPLQRRHTLCSTPYVCMLYCMYVFTVCVHLHNGAIHYVHTALYVVQRCE